MLVIWQLPPLLWRSCRLLFPCSGSIVSPRHSGLGATRPRQNGSRRTPGYSPYCGLKISVSIFVSIFVVPNLQHHPLLHLQHHPLLHPQHHPLHLLSSTPPTSELDCIAQALFLNSRALAHLDCIAHEGHAGWVPKYRSEALLPKIGAAARSARVGRRGRKQGLARSAGGRPTQGAHLDPAGRRQPGHPSLGSLKGAYRAREPAAKPWGMPGVPAAVGSGFVWPPDL